MKFGNAVKLYREKKNWTQRQLAQKSGVKYPSIVAYEQGLRSPNSINREKLLKAFGITEAQLFLSPEDLTKLKASVYEDSSQGATLSWSNLYKRSILSSFLKKGVGMFKLKLEGDVFDFKRGDVLDIEVGTKLESGKVYLLRDVINNHPIIKTFMKYGDLEILRDGDLEVAFDSSKYEVLGRVIRHTREL